MVIKINNARKIRGYVLRLENLLDEFNALPDDSEFRRELVGVGPNSYLGDVEYKVRPDNRALNLRFIELIKEIAPGSEFARTSTLRCSTTRLADNAKALIGHLTIDGGGLVKRKGKSQLIKQELRAASKWSFIWIVVYSIVVFLFRTHIDGWLAVTLTGVATTVTLFFGVARQVASQNTKP